jgi:4-diphosphocytidyl-2-C-methyl-D-erythritol kinase
MESIFLRAPAKVNLRLEILGKRSDGYHEIATWIYPIGLADELHIERVKTAQITISSVSPGLPLGEENLAHRAAALFIKERGLPGGVRIDIIKHIPLAAGLGGGSSDAAAVLKALNILWGKNIPVAELMEMGARIGADCPFFVRGKAAIMGGKGERVVSYLPPLKAWMVLINPGIPLSTKQVYEQGKWGLTKQGGETKISMPPQELEKMGKFLRNDLEGPARELLPIIATLKERLREAGASGVSMTGSGPTVFGLFATEAKARQAAEDLTMAPGWVCLVAKVLSEI